MMLTLFHVFASLALLACGWFADGWFQRRKIAVLHAQLKATRQTAAEHSDQARRQIGQLQAELAARPAATAAPRVKPAAVPAPISADTAAAAAAVRRAAAERLVPDHGFAQTAIGAAHHGFATTEVMNEPVARAR